MENENKPIPEMLQEIADAGGGEIKEFVPDLGDGSGFAVMSFPLRKDHWIYAKGYNVPPMPFRSGTADEALFAVQRAGEPAPLIMDRQMLADKIRAAGKYAIRCSTMNGTEMDFDPNAMLQNLVVGLIGYWTSDGLSSDPEENPRSGGVMDVESSDDGPQPQQANSAKHSSVDTATEHALAAMKAANQHPAELPAEEKE